MDTVKFYKHDARATIPKFAHEGDAGFDLTAIEVYYDVGWSQVVYETGIIAEIPEGWVGLLTPRSSLYRMKLRMPHSLGIIDSNYRGTLKVIFDITGGNGAMYGVGERMAQLVIVPHLSASEEIHTLTTTSRGAGGFGSTGE
jgi:dUTP pyrophosphatase